MNTYSYHNQKPMTTSRDIARIAGVSQATVSRVLQSHPSVRSETRQRVLQVLAETNYQPNVLARAMKTNLTGTIGVVVARLTNPLYPELLQLLGTVLAGADKRMLVWDSDAAGEQSAIDAIRQGLVDGVIFTTATADSKSLYLALEHGAPVVLVNRMVEGCPCDQVASDNRGGGQRVADYLVRSGLRRVGMISGPQKASTIRDREQGFREGLKAHGMDLARELYRCVETFSYKNGREAMLRLLELANPPDAVFCANDVIALGAIDGARSLGLRIPEDVWVVGYDDIEMASWDAFDLTTVRQPREDMARTAVKLLIERIGSSSQEWAIHCLPNELVIRGSTARKPFPNGDSGNPDRTR